MTAVLGFDLGTAKTGYAVLGYDHGELIAHGILRRSGDERSEWLTNMVDDIVAVVDEHQPFEVAIEAPMVVKQFGADLLLGLHGAVAVALWRRCMTAASIPAASAKKHATGSGRASKDQMRTAAFIRWATVLSEDEADSAWVADLARLRAHEMFDGESA